MLVLFAALLVVVWLVGLLNHVGGDYINLLLFIAVIFMLYDFILNQKPKS